MKAPSEKQILTILILLSVLLSYCSGQKSKNEDDKGGKTKTPEVIFEIEQNGVNIKPEKNIFSLNRSPFTIRLKMVNIDGAYVSTSFDGYYYNLTDSIDMKRLPAIILPEYGKNMEKEIYIDSVAFHFWCSCPEDLPPYFTNTFDKITTIGDTIIGERTIENYWSNKTDYKIETISSDIYIMLLVVEHKNQQPVKELNRQKYIIRFAVNKNEHHRGFIYRIFSNNSLYY
ncbi:MAG: hypothetical protein A2W91_05085 [Bacteroidetes bacterium GWF2_38_335]|nr:MAG: hypothetical protein A2W91_05085 [Bacteroidetes bacterium GWF2_38_335]OFY79796.1 MAG: hypothetical protein A2281_10335 [Bacteroidetes bacterium RIFOXYA12_FULL_38_20]HBS88184.1 hypothetical protein [Bacteroidales bacterium]